MPGAAPVLVLDAAATRARPLLWIAMAISVVAALSARDLWAPDEPRYALVARGMIETGELLVPRVAGQPYAEKPPLVMWAMAATGWIAGGLTPVAARLPCALLAALAVLSTARLARRWFGDVGLADTAALLFSTTGLILYNGARAGLDLPMTACALLALEAGTVLAARGTTSSALACGLALGAGLLAKGPHVFFVPVAALVGGCVAAGRPRRLLDPRWGLALLVALGVAAAWAVPAVLRAPAGPAYNSDRTYGERLLGQLASRISGESEPHSSPPWALLPQLLMFALPWTPLWLIALWAGRRPSRSAPEDRFGLGASIAGLVVPLVLLSIPATKREIYLIPLLPCAAILAAHALHRLEGSSAGLHGARIVGGVAAACALGLLAGPFLPGARWLPLSDEDRATAMTLTVGGVPFALGAAGALLGAGAVAISSRGDRPVAGARALAVALGAAWLVLAIAVLPAFDAWKSFRSAVAAGEAAAPGAPLAIAGTKDLSPLWAFRRDRVLPTHPFRFADAARILAPSSPRVLLLAKRPWWEGRANPSKWNHADPSDLVVLDRAVVVWERSIGGQGYVLLTNAAAP